jgi:hypothetical protein
LFCALGEWKNALPATVVGLQQVLQQAQDLMGLAMPLHAYAHLKDFLAKKMRMSHLYQPLMLKTLIERGGFAALRDIALSFLVHDESQIEYYIEITKRMPGPVLTRHQLVRRVRLRAQPSK